MTSGTSAKKLLLSFLQTLRSISLDDGKTILGATDLSFTYSDKFNIEI